MKLVVYWVICLWSMRWEIKSDLWEKQLHFPETGLRCSSAIIQKQKPSMMWDSDIGIKCLQESKGKKTFNSGWKASYIMKILNFIDAEQRFIFYRENMTLAIYFKYSMRPTLSPIHVGFSVLILYRGRRAHVRMHYRTTI